MTGSWCFWKAWGVMAVQWVPLKAVSIRADLGPTAVLISS